MSEFLAFLFSIQTMIYVLSVNAIVQILKYFTYLVPKLHTSNIKKFFLIVVPSIVSIALVLITGYYPAEINPFLYALAIGIIANKVFDVLKGLLKRIKGGENVS